MILCQSRVSLKMVMALGAAACFNQLAIFVTQIVMNNVLRYYGALSIYGSDIPLAVVGVGSKVNMVFSVNRHRYFTGCTANHWI